MKSKLLTTSLIAFPTFFGALHQAHGDFDQRIYAFRDLTPAQFERVMTDGEGCVEFVEGDDIPLGFIVTGDILETDTTARSPIHVKRSFYIERLGDGIGMSLDGLHFKPIQELLTGSLSAAASAAAENDPVTKIDVRLEAKLRGDATSK